MYNSLKLSIRFQLQFILTNMSSPNHQHYFSLCLNPNYRKDQIEYCKEIYEQYVKGIDQQSTFKRMFEALHSDWVNLQEGKQIHQQNEVNVLRAKTDFSEGDTLLEVRGGIIGKDKLRKLIDEKTVEKDKLPKVAFLNFNAQQTEVLVPKNLTKVILSTNEVYLSFLKQNQEVTNCILQSQLGSKYLISASKQIKSGQPLIIDLKSLQRYQYFI